ncbi:MAG: hypothetical protein KC978_03350 [Candidatus Omnitrophica bacterium]|nr:hypothetical protein [Candidatus Omnitrophota bacterium]
MTRQTLVHFLTPILLLIFPASSIGEDWTFHLLPPPEQIGHEEIGGIIETSEGKIWVGTFGGGVYSILGTETSVYDETDGLADNWIECLESDGADGVWVGAPGGLSHIVGGRVDSVTPDSSLRIDVEGIACLERLHDGALWIGLDRGTLLSLTTNSDGTFDWTIVVDSGVTKGNRIQDILETSSGDLWILVDGIGFLRRVEGEWLVQSPQDEEPSAWSGIAEDRSGTLWALGKERLYQFKNGDWIFDSAWDRHVRDNPARLSQIHDLIPLNSGELLVATETGIVIGENGEWSDLQFDDEIGHPNATSLLQSTEGSLWIGTEEGVLHGTPKSWRNHATTNEETRFAESTFHAQPGHSPMCADATGGIAVFEDGEWRVKHRLTAPILSLSEPTDTTIWALTETEAIEYSLSDSKVLRSIQIPQEATPERIYTVQAQTWLKAASGVYVLEGDRFATHPDGLNTQPGEVFQISEDRKGTLYLIRGSTIEQLKDGKYEDLSSELPALGRKNYTSILCATDDTVWIGTSGDGVFQLVGGKVRHFDHREGLISDQISKLFQSSDGTIWIAYSHRGIASYREGRVVNYTHGHGLPNTEIEGIGESPGGDIWLSARDRGLFRYQPESEPPDTIIEATPGELDYRSTGVLSFSGRDAWRSTEEEDLVYSWRFVPLSAKNSKPPEWGPFSSETTTLTPILPPGGYRFEVRAADLHRNIDPTPATVILRIAAPIWQRPAFFIPMGIVGAIAFLSLVGLIRNQAALRRSRDQLEDRVIERTSDLDRRNRELEGAIAEIKTLRGIIPICASCKKIRDDEGFWSQVEVYVSDHTDADFTHGICPECFEREMRELKG